MPSRISRHLLALFLLPLAPALMARAGLAQDTSQPYYSIKHPRVLVMTSGNSGDADIARQALSYAVTTVNFPTTFVDDSKLIDRQTFSQFDLFVQFGPARITPDQEKALWDLWITAAVFWRCTTPSTARAEVFMNNCWAAALSVMRVHITL